MGFQTVTDVALVVLQTSANETVTTILLGEVKNQGKTRDRTCEGDHISKLLRSFMRSRSWVRDRSVSNNILKRV